MPSRIPEQFLVNETSDDDAEKKKIIIIRRLRLSPRAM